jgi:hypothetical protein
MGDFSKFRPQTLQLHQEKTHRIFSVFWNILQYFLIIYFKKYQNNMKSTEITYVFFPVYHLGVNFCTTGLVPQLHHIYCVCQTAGIPLDAPADDATMSSVNWLQAPADQLKSLLSKVDSRVVKTCCDPSLSPKSPLKSKTAKYGAVTVRFGSCSLFYLA